MYVYTKKIYLYYIHIPCLVAIVQALLSLGLEGTVCIAKDIFITIQRTTFTRPIVKK
jgi:hypothetical protein